ncbi:MAG: MBL fold metallo-hydrolase [Halioglobus sp.]
MKMLFLSLLAATCMNAVFVSSAQSADAVPQVSITPLKGALYLLQGRGGNVVASLGEDGILIVDDDYAQYASAYQQALNKLRPDSTEIQTPSFVINTHLHGDHTGSNGFWGERGSVIVAHENVRLRMSSRQEKKALGTVVEPSPPAALPVVTYGDSLVLHFNGDDIEVQHFPQGHTDGDSTVFFSNENVVHMGDHFFKDAFPFIDMGSGGSVAGYMTNIATLLTRVDSSTVIVPGHGSVANKADLERYYGMLMATTAAVKAALASGLSVAEVVEQGLGDQWSSWGQGFINEEMWISTLAASEQLNH